MHELGAGDIVPCEGAGSPVHYPDRWLLMGVCAMCGHMVSYVSWVDGVKGVSVAVEHNRVDILGKLERGDYG